MLERQKLSGRQFKERRKRDVYEKAENTGSFHLHSLYSRYVFFHLLYCERGWPWLYGRRLSNLRLHSPRGGDAEAAWNRYSWSIGFSTCYCNVCLGACLRILICTLYISCQSKGKIERLKNNLDTRACYTHFKKRIAASLSACGNNIAKNTSEPSAGGNLQGKQLQIVTTIFPEIEKYKEF